MRGGLAQVGGKDMVAHNGLHYVAFESFELFRWAFSGLLTSVDNWTPPWDMFSAALAR